MPDEIEPPEIIEDGNAAVPENLDPLLGECSIAIARVMNGAQRSVRKFKRDDGVLIFARCKAVRLNFDRRCSAEKRKKIHEVADFPNNPAAPLLGIVDPVIFGQRSRIHAIVHDERRPRPTEEFLHLWRHRRKPAIEAHQARFTNSRRTLLSSALCSGYRMRTPR